MIKERKHSILRAVLAGVLGMLMAGLVSCDGCAPEKRHHHGAFCGNAVCDFNEDCSSCPTDCGACFHCAVPDFGIACGQYHDFNTTNWGDFLDNYSCPGWPGVSESGSDVVYQITTPSVCDLTAIVTSAADLNVFILDDANGQGCADQCLAAGIYWTVDADVPAGTYDIAVDGYALAEGAYTLDVVCSVCGDMVCDGVESCVDCAADCGTCPCIAPDFSLTLGVPVTSTTVGWTNRMDLYTCEQSRPWIESGPDVIYRVVIGGGCDLTAALTNLGTNDLDVFILAESGGQACVDNCLAPGNNRAIYYTAPAGTYDVVVDGYAPDLTHPGAQGPYTLTVTCA